MAGGDIQEAELIRPGRVIDDGLFDETANILERWLLGQLSVMVTIGVLSGIGLWALGIEAAFALGLVGGLLTFIFIISMVEFTFKIKGSPEKRSKK